MAANVACPSCGYKQNPPGSTRCVSCGAKIEALGAVKRTREEELERRYQQEGVSLTWLGIAFVVQAVLTAAHAAHPERFVRRPPKPLPLPSEVWINRPVPPGQKTKEGSQ